MEEFNIINICNQIGQKSLDLLKKNNYDKPGLLDGKAGVLLFLNNLYEVSKNSTVRDSALKLLDNLFEDIENKELKYDLSRGVAGIALAMIYLSKNDYINSKIEVDITDAFDEYLLKALNNTIRNNDYDLLTGYIGIGLYFIEKRSSPYYEQAIKNIVDALYDKSLLNESNDSTFFYDYLPEEDGLTPQVNIGLAHGMPSIIIFLSKLITEGYQDARVKKIIEKSISYILNHQLNDSEYLFPCYVPEYSPSRLSWCYGDLNIALMLYHAGKSLNNKKWIRQSTEISIHASNRRDLDKMNILDSCFCHGTSGISHIFNRLSNYLNCPELKQAANYWYKLTYENANSINMEKLKTFKLPNIPFEFDPSLLDGIAGIGLVLLSKISKRMNNWDKFLLIS